MLRLLRRWYTYLRRRMKRKAVRLEIVFLSPTGMLKQGDYSMTINVIQQVVATAVPVDARGNPGVPTSFSSPPSWSSSDTTVMTVAAAADGLSAVVTAAGKVGSATLSVSGTPVGATAPISGSATVSVVAAPAVGLTISFAAPTTQAPPTPPPPPAP